MLQRVLHAYLPLQLFVISLLPVLVQGQATVKKVIVLNDEVRILAEVLKENEKVPHGSYERQYQAKKQLVGNYDKGKKEGKWIRYFDSGEPMIVGFYENGKPTGKWVRLNRIGVEMASFTYKNGVPVGHWKSNYVNGNKGLDIVYENGFITQAVLYYYNERPGYLLEQELKSGDTLAYRSLYYKNQSIEEYRETLNKTLNGRLIKYHSTGAKWEELEYKFGKLFDIVSMRAQTGQPLIVGNFENGNGRVNHYYSNGMLYKREEFKDGQRNGYVTYEQNGKELGYGYYTKGKPSGKWMFRNALQFPDVEFEYDTVNFDTARVVVRVSANLNEAKKGTLIKGVRFGNWYATGLTGDTIESLTYNNGLLDGPYMKYTPTIRNVQATGMYSCGTRSEVWRIYNPFDQQTELDSIKTNVTCNFIPSKQVVNNWIPVQEAFGYYYLSDDVFGQIVSSKDIVHYVPELPGMELITTPLTFGYQVIDPLEPKQGKDYSYLPLLSGASFPEGDENELIYLDRHRDLQDKAEEEGLVGSMLVGIRLDQFGLIEDVEILRGLESEFDQGVKEFIRQMPVWMPATYNGLPIPSYVIKRMDFSANRR